MRYSHKLFFCCLFVAALMAFSHEFIVCGWAVEDAIIAQVNDELITMNDLEDYIHTAYVQLTTEGVPEKEIQPVIQGLRNNGINKLIEDRLILSEAKRLGIAINEKALNNRISNLKKRFASEEDFMAALVKSGSNMSELRDAIENQMKIQYTIENEVKSKVFVNPGEINTYYKKNIDKFQKRERVNLDSIFISLGQDPIATRARAQIAYQLIIEGKNFAEVAREYSETPSIGIIERGEILPEIEEVIFKMSEGMISEPIEVETGIYIFCMKGKMAKQISPLETVKKEIQERLFMNKFRVRYNAWIEDIKKRAYVEIKKK